MEIAPFGVEQWMNAWETRCALNLAETCVHSITLGELLAMTGQTGQLEDSLRDLPLTYGPIPGSDRLRGLIAGLFETRSASDVLVAHGTIGANMLVYQALVGPGDRVVSITPTYQQHVSIPEALGAEVVEMRLGPEDGWLPDPDRLRALVTPGTRLVTLTNPGNPTGALIGAALLKEIVDIARAAGAWLLCDEVYRGTEDGETTPAVADLYEKGISTGGLSKVFSLAGLRIGWLVGPAEVLEAAERHRDYSTISVSRIDDHLACLALSHAGLLVDRARRITSATRVTVDDWVQATPGVDWVRPEAGTTGLLHYGGGRPSHELAEHLIAQTGVMLTPGSAMGVEGTLRIGHAQPAEILSEGLSRLGPLLSGLSAD